MGQKITNKSAGKARSPKGEISVENNAGRIRLRWRYRGERFALNLPLDYLPENLQSAAIKVAEIKLDMAKGEFDSSLEKYKPNAPDLIDVMAPKDMSISAQDPIPSTPVITAELSDDPPPILITDLEESFNTWCRVIRNVDIENAGDYYYIRSWLQKQVLAPVMDIAEQLDAAGWGVSTYNRRMTYLRSFLTWVKAKGGLQVNPLELVVKRKGKKRVKRIQRRPLSEKEILSILNAFKNNRFCSKFARPSHSFYYPFVAFLFYTGTRNAEAIGLRVKHLDFKNGLIEISETFARTIKGYHHAARVKKATKTENERYVQMTEELLSILLPQIEGKQPNDFVFHSFRGKSINDQMFQKRIFKPILKILGIDERDLYSARHSFGTRAVQQHMALTDVAYVMGHASIQTAIRNYVAVMPRKVELPKIKR